MKNKNKKRSKKHLLAAVLIGSGMATVLASAQFNAGSSGQANLLDGDQVAQIEFLQTEEHSSGPTEEAFIFEDTLDIETTSEAPDSSDFLNTFNVYKGEFKSELELLALYKDLIKDEDSDIHRLFMTEILSFVHRTANSPYVYDKLPMWPEYNIATVGNVLAYLFPQESNPMLFAKGLGIVPLDAKSHSYLSRAEFMEMVGRIFLNDDSNTPQTLLEAGFIDDPEIWKSTTKEGFLLVEALRMILNIREVIERSNIREGKAFYQEDLVALPNGALHLNEDSLRVMLKAFQGERNPEQRRYQLDRTLVERISQRFGSRFGEELNAYHIKEAREAFYQFFGEEAPAVYELPAIQTLGACSTEGFRKSYMGPVAVTGPQGSSIICGKVMIHFPANAFLLNVFALPKLTLFTDGPNGGIGTMRTDAMRSYYNAIIANTDKEQQVTMLYRPDDLDALQDKNFGFTVADHDGNELVSKGKAYGEEGALVRVLLRSLSGDNLLGFMKEL